MGVFFFNPTDLGWWVYIPYLKQIQENDGLFPSSVSLQMVQKWFQVNMFWLDTTGGVNDFEFKRIPKESQVFLPQNL